MEPPRKASAGLLGAREYLGMAVVGAVMGGIGVACYLVPWDVDGSTSQLLYGRALAFSLLALSPLFHAFSCRSATRSILSLRPMWSVPLLAAVGISAAIHLVSVLVPGLRTVFQTYALDGKHWLALVGLSFSIVPVIELLKLLQRAGTIGKDLGPMSKRG
jgi:Ca2+-transporting ATPase